MTRGRVQTRAGRAADSGRLSRRRLIAVGAAGGAGALLIACGGDSDTPDQQAAGTAATGTGGATAAETPKPGGSLREATITQAPHFSPYHPGADPSYVNTWRRVNGYYDTLWTFRAVDVPDRLTLRAAATVEQPDPATYVVKLHPARFHNRSPVNGRDVTAEDVAATVQFLTKPPASGSSFLQSGQDLKSVSAIDAQTVRFETFGPRAFFYEDGTGVVSRAVG